MNVPLNFLNKIDITYIDCMVDIYFLLYKEEKKLVSYEDKEYILKSFSKRQLIDGETLINLCSVMTLVIISIEDYKFDKFDISKAKDILLRLVIYHSDKISEECFENNISLFRYIYRC